MAYKALSPRSGPITSLICLLLHPHSHSTRFNHIGKHLTTSRTPSSGTMHRLFLLCRIFFLQLATWFAHSSPLSLCSNVTSMRPTLTTFVTCPSPTLQPSLISIFSQYVPTSNIHLFIMFMHKNTRSTRAKFLSLFTNEYSALDHYPAHNNIIEWLNVLMR